MIRIPLPASTASAAARFPVEGTRHELGRAGTDARRIGTARIDIV
jgi:hypothetical protein